MKESKNILQNDVEVPKIVFDKADQALRQIQKKKRFLAHVHHAQAAAVACVILLGTAGITATAAVVHHLWSRGMQGNIQATEEQQRDLTELGMATTDTPDLKAMQVTSGGVTIQPLEMIADGHFVHLSFQVHGFDLPDGEEPGFETVLTFTGDSKDAEDGYLNMNGGFYNGIVTGSNGEPVYEDGTVLANDENGALEEHYKAEEGTLEYVMMLYDADPDETLLGKTVHVQFENLGTLHKTMYTEGIKGEWKFDIPITGKDAARSYEVNETLSNTAIEVTSAEISPISIRVNYKVNGEVESKEDENGLPHISGVIMKDGTKYPYLVDGSMRGDSYELGAFERVIDPEQIKALLFQVNEGDNAEDYVEVALETIKKQ